MPNLAIIFTAHYDRKDVNMPWFQLMIPERRNYVVLWLLSVFSAAAASVLLFYSQWNINFHIRMYGLFCNSNMNLKYLLAALLTGAAFYWFQSYLSNGKSFSTINQSSSTLAPVNQDVHQASVFEPSFSQSTCSPWFNHQLPRPQLPLICQWPPAISQH